MGELHPGVEDGGSPSNRILLWITELYCDMLTDPQWFANDTAVIVAVISGIALLVSGAAAVYSYRQARAAERQARVAEETLRLQAQALKTQAEDTARALALAERSAAAMEASVIAFKEVVESIDRNAAAARTLDSMKC
jgi:hypothetical protein